jgi:hypothetical protein
MNTRIYRSIQHARWMVHEIRFKCNCWWLSQRVGFLEWRLGLDAPEPQPVPIRVVSK